MLAGLLILTGSPALANRLQVAPTLIEIAPGRPAEAIWLTNPGQAAVPVQVRVFRWDQRDGTDRLDPTEELIVSPSQVVIAPGQRQLIRILREGEAPGSEASYRILVDELVGLSQTEEPPKGLQFRLRYSIPVFVAPRSGSSHSSLPSLSSLSSLSPFSSASSDPSASAASSGASSASATFGAPHDSGPRLAAALRRDPASDASLLEIDNAGRGRARLAEVSLLAPGKAPVELSPGLLGYVLAGQSMRWPVEMPGTAKSKPLELKVRVNGETAPRLIPVRVIEAR